MRQPQAFPIAENDAADDMHEAMLTKRGCCFILPCLGSSQPSDAGSVWWQRIRTADKREADERWWIRGWRKLREWSELVAGPKWKTFIRRLGRHRSCCGGGISARPDHGTYRYDPLSYSLNFDDGGAGPNGHFDDGVPYRDFSARFTGPPSLPVSTKCSIDFDNDFAAHAPQLSK
ncbi:PREDICTED: uncharacterized protein LOC104821066 isoform X2 [Tarenaya hassleriana]|uniref:uncharacterized protein LOC104821066 isoform X1 n=1 Tax=Tarenaya hassleriana TaxID=28532 RepID=UPI00053C9B6D|nr:PREDICTED: uncharacterized protein LOC104821066 isoform X1 [Tarenaya hassleriana]XP_010550112.1 PREDICTED: uncharacterized protein LOC104821066 isoform X2 [Tarenaya hassleriana]